jgi:hypothetical protein
MTAIKRHTSLTIALCLSALDVAGNASGNGANRGSGPAVTAGNGCYPGTGRSANGRTRHGAL